MFEIIAILILSGKISTKARVKGYLNTGRFVLLFILMWFSFEFIGAIIGTVISQNIFARWFFAIAFALIGAFISFVIVNLLKTKEILTEYDSNIKIELPFIVNLLKENIISIIAICIICTVLIYYISNYFIIFPILIFLFTKYGIYKINFQSDEIIIKYLYGRKKIIKNNQLVKTLINNKLLMEIHWKKSTKHSTKSIKFSSSAFLVKKIPIENIKQFLLTTYSH